MRFYALFAAQDHLRQKEKNNNRGRRRRRRRENKRTVTTTTMKRKKKKKLEKEKKKKLRQIHCKITNNSGQTVQVWTAQKLVYKSKNPTTDRIRQITKIRVEKNRKMYLQFGLP